MTKTKTAVANKLVKLGKFCLYSASLRARTLSVRVMSKCKSAMMAPSNSVPLPVLMVVGKKAFHMIVSQMLVAMKREMPDPRLYPFCSSLSNVSTMRPEHKSCAMIKMALPAPMRLLHLF